MAFRCSSLGSSRCSATARLSFRPGMYSFDWGVGDVNLVAQIGVLPLAGRILERDAARGPVRRTSAVMWLGVSMTTLATAFLVGFSGEREALEAALEISRLMQRRLGFALLGILMLARLAATLDWSDVGTHPSTPLARIADRLADPRLRYQSGPRADARVASGCTLEGAGADQRAAFGVLVSCSLYAIMRVTNRRVRVWRERTAAAHAVWRSVPHRRTHCRCADARTERSQAHARIFDGRTRRTRSAGNRFWRSARILRGSFPYRESCGGKVCGILSAGMVQRERETTALRQLHGLWESGPAGRTLLAALLALCGLPPFGLFISEFCSSRQALLRISGSARRRFTWNDTRIRRARANGDRD